MQAHDSAARLCREVPPFPVVEPACPVGYPQPSPGAPCDRAGWRASAQTGCGASEAAPILTLSCNSWSQVFPGDAPGSEFLGPVHPRWCPGSMQVLLKAKQEKSQGASAPFPFSIA